MTCVSKEYEIKTMEQEQCLQLKLLFLLGFNLKIVVQWEGGIKIQLGQFFMVGGMSKFSAGGGGELSSMENPGMCYFWVYMIHHSGLYDSAKTACFGKIFLKLYTEMLLSNQIARFFKFQYHKNCLRYKFPFLNVVKGSWRLQFDHVIFFGFS